MNSKRRSAFKNLYENYTLDECAIWFGSVCSKRERYSFILARKLLEELEEAQKTNFLFFQYKNNVPFLNSDYQTCYRFLSLLQEDRLKKLRSND